MVGLDELISIVRREVADYNNVEYWKEIGYYFEDTERLTFVVLAAPLPDHPIVKRPGITVMARIVENRVIIDEDITDRPLYLELMRCGIPREQIILKYAGEKAPETMTTEG